MAPAPADCSHPVWNTRAWPHLRSEDTGGVRTVPARIPAAVSLRGGNGQLRCQDAGRRAAWTADGDTNVMITGTLSAA